MNSRLPVTVFTGFLGSGKTTVLRHLLTESKLVLAVMINEFGSVGLDGDLIKTCDFCPEEDYEGRIVELNNGCLCCTVQDDFLPTIKSLLSSKNKLDGIVIETSGLALPRPLIKALEWPEIKSEVYLNAVVTLVDSEALSNGSPVGDMLAIEKQREEDDSLDHLTPVNDLFDNQLKAADLVLMSRSDLISNDLVKLVAKDLQDKVPKGTSVFPISNGVVEPSIILNFNKSNLPDTNSKTSIVEEHDHLDVFSDSLQIEIETDKLELEIVLTEISKTYQLLRVKGRLWIKDKKLPLQIQMVGRRITTWFEKAPPNCWRPQHGGLEIVVLSLKEGATKAISIALS